MIELLIVVVIVGILAAIAYPSYRSQMLKSRRSDGQALLLDVATRQERFFSDNGRYADNTGLSLPAVTAAGYYAVTIDAPVVGTCELASCFIARATAQNGQEQDKCGNLTLTSTGVKGITGTEVAAADCW